MDEQNTLGAMGFTLPSPAYIVGSIVFSVIGYAAYRYGKKLSLEGPRWIGIALMLYSYFTPETWMVYAGGVGLCVGLYFFRR